MQATDAKRLKELEQNYARIKRPCGSVILSCTTATIQKILKTDRRFVLLAIEKH